MDIKEDTNIEEAMTKPPMVTDLDDPTDNEGVETSKRRSSDAGLSKISVDQLIVKSPNDNLSVSAKSSVKEVKCAKKTVVFDGSVFWLGVLQIFFGLFMMTFGVYAILHEAAMSLFASGVWTGLIAISTGIFGILATATRCCPVEERWRKLSKTLFVALSLISVALSQLVVVLSGIGLARDLNNNENNEQNQDREVSIGNPFIQSKFSIIIPENYYGILANVALLIVSALEFICALLSSYKGAKALCPCFEKEKIIYTGLPVNNSHALVSSWLGKHTPPPQLYVVTSSSTLGRGTKNSGGLSITPVFTYPPPVMAQQIMGVPLIPAPLGTIPSPIIPPSKKHHHIYSRHVPKSKTYPHRPREKTPRLSRSRSRSQSKAHEEVLTEKDVAKTYTGLDKEIAEQFIERCETKKQSTSTVSSKTSCDNSSSSSLPTASTSGSSTDTTTNSKEALVNN